MRVGEKPTGFSSLGMPTSWVAPRIEEFATGPRPSIHRRLSLVSISVSRSLRFTEFVLTCPSARTEMSSAGTLLRGAADSYRIPDDVLRPTHSMNHRTMQLELRSTGACDRHEGTPSAHFASPHDYHVFRTLTFTSPASGNAHVSDGETEADSSVEHQTV